MRQLRTTFSQTHVTAAGVRLSLALALFATVLSASSAATEAADYVGSKACGQCHEEAYRAWQGSLHKKAMEVADDSTVLGDFDNARFEHFGVTSTFFRKDGQYLVRTDNAEGELQDFRVSYTFGAYPLQQYLIEFDDGRLQALSMAWDSRPAQEGGQRWFHLYPDEAIPHEDPLHWTGAFQNWNSRCASCHSTNLEKHYDPATDRYQTTWSEINVACEACHGAGSTHLKWAEGDRASADKGLPATLAERRTWKAGAIPAAEGGSATPPHRQLDACAGCHSRRQELGQPAAGREFLDQFSPQLLTEGLYYPDGQIEDEVYVYGSFLQSRMHAAGVVCSNCHEPHGLTLKAQGNALCTQCHQSSTFDAPAHHHHEAGSAGALCANCHMPERTYMGVDARRDHSFRIPQPILGGLLGTPNACQNCHQDRDNSWAQKQLAQWYGHQPLRDEHATTLAIARANNPAAMDMLVELARDDSVATIVRATAVLESGRFSSPQVLQNNIQQLYADDALMRLAAVRALDNLPTNQRYQLLQPLIADPVKAVRTAVASSLAEVPTANLQPSQQAPLEALFAEYVETLNFTADMPGSQLNLGLFYIGRGDHEAAVKAYRHALQLAPRYVPALLNLADLYRAMGEDENARPLLEQAIRYAPDQAPAYHSLGLLLVRENHLSRALPHLQRAAQLDPGAARYSFVYGVALYSSGQVDAAIEVLSDAAQAHPHDRQIQGALEAYRQQQ